MADKKQNEKPDNRMVTPDPKDVHPDPNLVRKARAEEARKVPALHEDEHEPRKIGRKGPLKVGVTFDANE